ncbi:MAG: ABC transporter permease, partial [Clostridia bacterium]|nr:ABC transporter permease [Clostridia bacterium]
CMPVSFIENKFNEINSAGNLTEEDFKRLLAIYGLEDNSFGGIIRGYFGWLGNFLKGDMGVSFQKQNPVSQVIGETMGISFGIAFVALIIELIIAIPLGIKCATNQYGKFDYATTVLCMTLMAFPSFFLGNLFIKIFAVDLGWFDIGGLNSGSLQGVSFFVRFGDMVWHLILPITVMVLLDIGPMMRYTRTNTLEVLNADYIRTARAKGLSESKVVYKHVFRNTLIPLITLLSSTLPMLFGGAMITETVFAIPGIGQTAYNALKVGDIPLAMGYNMFIAILTVVGVLLADIMYAVVDPRVKLGK